MNKNRIESEVTLIKKVAGWFLQPKATILLMIATIVISLYAFNISDKMFSNFVLSVPNILSGNYFSVISYMFLHGNFNHLVSNMVFLFVMGRILEGRIGGLKMALFYLGSGVFAGLLNIGLETFVLGRSVSIIGASGAVSGLIAATLLYRPFQITFLLGIPLPVLVVGWGAVLKDVVGATAQLVGIDKSNIAFFGHIGGYIGMILLLFLFAEDKGTVLKGFLVNVAFVAILVLTGILGILA